MNLFIVIDVVVLLIKNKLMKIMVNGFKTSDILMLDVCNHGCILRLHKQRFLCHSCNKKFFARTKIVNDGCFISNQVKYAIALELKNKISEKDIEYPLILLKELLILIMMVKNFINIIYLKFFLLMNLNLLSQLMVLLVFICVMVKQVKLLISLKIEN